MKMFPILLLLSILSQSIIFINADCPNGSTTFELITGHVFTSPSDTVIMIPGVLHLAECLDHCRQNQTCSSLNFETGLCVLLSSSARQLPQALTPSQFPVFTIYAEKICLKGLTNDCLNSGWSFERVIGYELREHEKKLIQTPTSLECMQACIDEDKFQCRSINYEEKTKECLLSDMNRHTININTEIRSMKYGPSSTGFDYLEFNCVQEPRKLCDFKPIEGKILKTVDSVYQNINNLEECQQKCLNGPFRCYSYDFGDPSNPVCRISHLDKVSLIQIENPYIDILGAATYELQACYDVNIKCESRAMTAKVRSSKIFDGKIYAKHKPYHCMSDINESLEFEIQMAYNDLECDVKQISRGQYSNDIVIQHHDMIVTTQDLGLNINCKYDLSNRSISNNVNLDITGNLQPIGTHSAVVESPNVTMTIINMDGDNVRAAKVGDPLVLQFQISDQSSPYGMFVRELVALDGIDMSEFVLIDSDGCPTDMTIMKPIVKSRDDSKMFETNFEAFKFPTSDIVQFKALITPCITNCEPMNCQYDLPNGRTHSSLSYGRRRRRSTAKSRSANAPQNDMIVVESLSVTDKFSNKQKSKKKTLIEQNDHSTIYATIDDGFDSDRISRIEVGSPCINTISMMVFAIAFLLCQTIMMASWSYVWSRKRKQSLLDTEANYNGAKWPTRASPLSLASSSASSSVSNASSMMKFMKDKSMNSDQVDSFRREPRVNNFSYSVPSRFIGYFS